jgi:outer membrane protein, adhesin transport system
MTYYIFFRVLKILICLAALGSTYVLAQTSQDELSNLLRSALISHPSLRAKTADRNAARTGVTIAERQFWLTPSIANDVGPVDSMGRNHALTARLSYPIFTGGQLTADLESADLRQRIAEYEVEITSRELALQFIDLYRAWWLQSARIENLSDAKIQMGQLRDMLKRRTQAGVSAQLDLAQAELQLSRLQDEHRQALKLRDQTLAEITTFSGVEIHPEFYDLSQWLPSPFTQISDLSERVFSTHPSINTSQLQITLAQTELKKIQAGTLPSVNLRLEKQYGSYLGALSPASRIYLNTQLTLGAGLSALPMQEQSLERIQAAEMQATATRLNLSTQVQRIWNERAQATELMTSTARQLAAQKELAAAGVRLFTSGRRSWQDLLNLQREVYQLMTQQNDAEAAYLSANWRMQLLGNNLPQFSFSSI